MARELSSAEYDPFYPKEEIDNAVYLNDVLDLLETYTDNNTVESATYYAEILDEDIYIKEEVFPAGSYIINNINAPIGSQILSGDIIFYTRKKGLVHQYSPNYIDIDSDETLIGFVLADTKIYTTIETPNKERLPDISHLFKVVDKATYSAVRASLNIEPLLPALLHHAVVVGGGAVIDMITRAQVERYRLSNETVVAWDGIRDIAVGLGIKPTKTP